MFRLFFILVWLAPVSMAAAGAVGSVVVVKAPLDNQDEKLIPGTTCVAQISGRRHPGGSARRPRAEEAVREIK
mgnify:CR=1 FL=1